MSAGTAAITHSARRPVNLIMIIATLVGLWFGLTAPEVSPVVAPALGGAAGAAMLINTDADNAIVPVADEDEDDGDDGDRRGGGPR